MNKYSKFALLLLASHSVQMSSADDLSDLNSDPAVKELRLKAAIQAAQIQLEAVQAQAAEAKLRAAVTQAELAASLAGHQSTVATKEKEVRESLFGETVAPVEGTITATSKAEAIVIASQQLDTLAREIAAELRSRCALAQGNRVFLLGGQPDATIGNRIRSYKAIMVRLQSISNAVSSRANDLNTFIRESDARRKPPEMGPARLGTLSGGSSPLSALSAPSMLQAGLSLAALFRTDRNFSDTATSFEDSALVASVAHHLIGYPPPEAEPGQVPPATLPNVAVFSSTMSTGASALIGRLSDLQTSQVNIDTELTRLAAHEALLKDDVANIKKKIEVLEGVAKLVDASEAKAREAKAAQEEAARLAKLAADETVASEKEKKEKAASEARVAAEAKAKEATEANSAATRAANDAKTTVQAYEGVLEQLRALLQTIERDVALVAVHRANATKASAAAEAEIKQFASGTIDGAKVSDLMEAEYLGTALARPGSYVVFLKINLMWSQCELSCSELRRRDHISRHRLRIQWIL